MAQAQLPQTPPDLTGIGAALGGPEGEFTYGTQQPSDMIAAGTQTGGDFGGTGNIFGAAGPGYPTGGTAAAAGGGKGGGPGGAGGAGGAGGVPGAGGNVAGYPATPGSPANIRDILSKLLGGLFQGGSAFGATGTAPTAGATPPNLFSAAQTAIQTELARQQQAQANEAAATGGAGSRDLAYRQGLLGENAAVAAGKVAPQYQAQQFNLAETQARTNAELALAQFRQVTDILRTLGMLGGMGGGGGSA